MLKKATLVKQIYVTVNNEVGVLNRMADYLADRGINIEAVAGYEMTGTDKARVMLVVDDTRRATDLLKQKGFTTLEEREEILVELVNKPGSSKIRDEHPGGQGDQHQADLRNDEHGEIPRPGGHGHKRQPDGDCDVEKSRSEMKRQRAAKGRPSRRGRPFGACRSFSILPFPSGRPATARRRGS